ncbi:MAG: hypothetical protein K2H39_05095, partial [Paramuribaculum sp.]|nr:hypothetical protein [Paramuribaculum sp.]
MKQLIFIAVAVILTACINDDISTSPSHMPEFSADTVALGEVWADELSPNVALTIYNRNPKGITISSLSVSGRDADCLKMNLDGMPAELFAPVDIRQNDSVQLLVAAVPQIAGAIDAVVNITVNSKVLSLPVKAEVLQPVILKNHTVAAQESLAGKVRVFGTLTVPQGAELSIEPGTTLFMHDKAEIVVDGTLIAQGTPQLPITICGDRFGFMAADIPYSILPGQWRGITLNSAQGCEMTCVSLLNSEAALTLSPDAQLTMTNCCIANSRETLVSLGEGARLAAYQCQFTEAAQAVLALNSADAYLYRCTLANAYLFSTPFSSLIELSGTSDLTVEASIIYRPGGELSAATGSAYKFSHTLFGSNGSDDEQFVNCLWAENPLFNLDLEEYHFDYTLSPESPARKHSAPAAPLNL